MLTEESILGVPPTAKGPKEGLDGCEHGQLGLHVWRLAGRAGALGEQHRWVTTISVTTDDVLEDLLGRGVDDEDTDVNDEEEDGAHELDADLEGSARGENGIGSGILRDRRQKPRGLVYSGRMFPAASTVAIASVQLSVWGHRIQARYPSIANSAQVRENRDIQWRFAGL